MPNENHVKILKQGVQAWNEWRKENPRIKPDISNTNLSRRYLPGVNFSETDLRGVNLRGATLNGAILSKANIYEADLRSAKLNYATLIKTDLRGANLRMAVLFQAELGGAKLVGADLSSAQLPVAYLDRADLSGANLSNANFREAIFTKANLSRGNLSGADLRRANLNMANLREVDLRKANLSETSLTGTNLRKANLEGANLRRAILVETKLASAKLNGCKIYGISVWNLQINRQTEQNALIITSEDEPVVTVDNLQVAQFIYLMLNNKNIRDVISTVANKAVLILGRFTPERKGVLDAIADKLRSVHLAPIIFDFEKSKNQDIIETIKTLAGISKFIIADVTAARVIPDELRAVVPDFAVPVIPLFQPSNKEQKPYASLYTLQKYPWVLPLVKYASKKQLIDMLVKKVVEPAEKKRLELVSFK